MNNRSLLLVWVSLVLFTSLGAHAVERKTKQPDFNGIWRAINSAYWNLEAHSASAPPSYWQLGALTAIPAGKSVVEGGTIPYLPEALKKREQNQAAWPKADPEARCYLPGIPRATYLPHAFQIIQGGGDILFAYEFTSANRLVNMVKPETPPIDTWMGVSNGSFEGDTLVVVTTGQSADTWFDRAGNHHSEAMKVTERFKLIDKNHIQYEALIDDPKTFSRPWKIRMPLYRAIEEDAELLDFKCVPFAEPLIYEEIEKTRTLNPGKK